MKKVIWAALILGLVVVFGGFFGLVWYVQALFAPINPADQTEIHYVVAKGSSLGAVAADLEAQGIVKSAEGLRLYARIFHVGDSVQAGEHILHRSDDAAGIISSLEMPPAQVTFTILPGWRREEIAAYLSTAGLSEFDDKQFLALTADLEGQLMPETYKIAPLSDTATIVDVLHGQFVHDILENPELQPQFAASSYSQNEIITLASLLQREGKSLSEMKMIAGILYSRLEDHYPLQLCASAQYATGQDSESGKWWEPPTLADTQFDSPYNTYVNKGLPPGPISTVSVDAVRAALDPTPSDYYYYLHDSDGQIHYATTLDGHERNKSLYL